MERGLRVPLPLPSKRYSGASHRKGREKSESDIGYLLGQLSICFSPLDPTSSKSKSDKGQRLFRRPAARFFSVKSLWTVPDTAKTNTEAYPKTGQPSEKSRTLAGT